MIGTHDLTLKQLKAELDRHGMKLVLHNGVPTDAKGKPWCKEYGNVSLHGKPMQSIGYSYGGSSDRTRRSFLARAIGQAERYEACRVRDWKQRAAGKMFDALTAVLCADDGNYQKGSPNDKAFKAVREAIEAATYTPEKCAAEHQEKLAQRAALNASLGAP